MAILEGLLGRFGFVKLGRYGLALTDDGRVVSLKSAVLDDGSGGRVVGWKDGDLAELALQRLEVSAPVAKPAPAPVFPTTIATTALAAAERVTAPVAPPPPAPPPKVEEEDDDWEWVVAMARARAAAEEVEVAAKAPVPPPAVVARPKPATRPPATPPPRVKAEPVTINAAIAAAQREKALAATKTVRHPVPEAPTPRPMKQTLVQPPPVRSKRPSAPPARNLPLPPSEETVRTKPVAAKPAPVAKPAPQSPLPPDEVTQTAVTKVHDAKLPEPPAPSAAPVGEETRKDVKPAPLPRLSQRFAV